jgi:hypothetical protein
MATDLFIAPGTQQSPPTNDTSSIARVPMRPRAMLNIITASTQDDGVPKKLRAASARPFQLTERERDVLHAVHRFRVLDRHQIQSLFFPNYSKACARLHLLYQHGFLERLYRLNYLSHARRGPVYRLGLRGAKMLADEIVTPLAHFDYWGKGDDRDGHQTQVGPVYLEHLVLLADIRVALERAATNAGCSLPLWQDEWDIRRAKRGDPVRFEPAPGKGKATVTIIPDGYFVLTTTAGDTGHFFLEADRGTESIAEKWRRKILSYKALFSSGVFHRRYGIRETTTAFRVLVTTPSLTRAQNLKAAAEKWGEPRLSQLFLFGPILDVTIKDAIYAPIWLRGGATEAQALVPKTG